MKKVCLSLIALLMLTTGCGKSSLNANQIQYKSKTLEYGTSNIDDVFLDSGIDLTLNDSNQIRSITITNEDVKTFNNLSVGDKITKVQSDYKYETEVGDMISVTLYNNNEIDAMKDDKPEDTIYINYFCNNDVIEKIQIYDYTYATKMK